MSCLDDGKRKTKRGWSPGDSLNLVRVLSVRVNYSQQCRNDINGRWEYSKSIINHYQTKWCAVYLCHTHPLGNFILNSLAPGRFGRDFKNLIFNLVLLIGILRSLYDNALRSVPQNITGKSTLVQVMAWGRQATSHYLSQCWPRSMLPYGVIRPQWVKNKRNLFLRNQNHWFLQAFHHIYDIVQDCNNSVANALELLRSCSKPLISKCIFSVTGIHNFS